MLINEKDRHRCINVLRSLVAKSEVRWFQHYFWSAWRLVKINGIKYKDRSRKMQHVPLKPSADFWFIEKNMEYSAEKKYQLILLIKL